MKLYLKNSRGIEEEISQPISFEEVKTTISEFLNNQNYNSNYNRIYRDNMGRYIFDFGSYTEFFILDGHCEELEKLNVI